MTNYDLLNQDKAKNEGVEWANEHLDMVKNALSEIKKNPDERKIYELSIEEFKEIMIECFEMLKQRELDTSIKEYTKLTAKPENPEMFIRDGKLVSKEW